MPVTRAEHQKLDGVLLVEADPVHVWALGRLAAQVVLGERWALVGAVRLVAEEHEATVESLCSQGLRCLRSSEAGADDDEGLLMLAHLAPFAAGSTPRLSGGLFPVCARCPAWFLRLGDGPG